MYGSTLGVEPLPQTHLKERDSYDGLESSSTTKAGMDRGKAYRITGVGISGTTTDLGAGVPFAITPGT